MSNAWIISLDGTQSPMGSLVHPAVDMLVGHRAIMAPIEG